MGQTPKILLFTDTIADVNGVTRFLRAIAADSRRRRRRFGIITSTRLRCPDLPELLNLRPRGARPMPGYPHIELAIPPVGALLRCAASERPDAVHVSTPGPVGLLGVLFARRRRLPLLGVYHTDFPAFVRDLFADHVLARACEATMRTFYRRFDLVLARSAAYIEPLRDLGLRPQRLDVLTPGCDTASFHPRHRDRSIWPRLGLDPRSVKVLYCGRVSVEKNLPVLARAWRDASARLAAQSIQADLVVVGDGPYREEMQRRLGGARAHFLGYRHGDDLCALYASADLFVFPSATDTLGQAVLEAQASALPAIVTTAGGPAHIVAKGRTGLVVPPGDAAALAEAIADLAADPARRDAMGRAARDAMADHTLEAMFESFWSAHDRVVRHGRRRPGPRGRPLKPTGQGSEAEVEETTHRETVPCDTAPSPP